MKKAFQHFSPYRIVNKTFATSTKLNAKQTITTIVNPQVEYKQFFFKHQNIEYKAQVPKRPNQTLKEFLETFAKERSTSVKQYNYRDFEVCRCQKYLNLTKTINDLETTPNDKEPITILDSTLTLSNIKFRELRHLSHPFTDSSQALQVFLNSFLDKFHPDMEKLNKDSIITNLKSLQSLEKNKSKTENVITGIMNQLQNIFPDKNLKLEFMSNYKLDLSEYDKSDVEGAFIMRNVFNNVHIPVNILPPMQQENEKISRFNEEIINNMDILRKLAIKNNNILNFGVITDFHNWKINMYHKPKDDQLEKPNDYLTSLKYSLSVSAVDLSLNSISIILRVLAGILTVDQKEVSKRTF